MANQTSRREMGPSISRNRKGRALPIVLQLCLFSSLLRAQAIVPVSGSAIHAVENAAATLKVPSLQSSGSSSDIQPNFKSFLLENQRQTNSLLLRAAMYRFSRNSTALVAALTSTAQRSNDRNWIYDVSRHRFTFEPSYSIAPQAAVGSTPSVEQYVRHIPAAGPLVVRICQRTKAHPRLTRALSMFRPDP
jgi:hypothetical protein